MKNYNLINVFNFVLILFVSCSNAVFANEISVIKEVDYKKLCGIYSSVISKSKELSSKEMLLTEKVQNDLPELFNGLFIHIIKANSNIRYKLIKDFAQQQNNIVWECGSAQKYYADNFR